MSNRMGKALAEETSFHKQDYRKFLNELIENKLLKIEAENLGLDKEADFVSVMQNYLLNQRLQGLRQKEIVEKVDVTDKEIEDYYKAELKKKQEEKAEKDRKEAEAADKKPNGKHDAAVDDKKEGEAKAAEGQAVKKEEEETLSPKDRERIKSIILNKKTAEREKEYLRAIREKADVNINKDVLKTVSKEKPETLEQVVATVNGQAISGKELLGNLMLSRKQDTDEERERIIETIILHRLLDQKAMQKDYLSDPETSARIKNYRDKLLINDFKRKIIIPAIKTEDKEIAEYYDKYKDGKFREPATAEMGLILLVDKPQADEAMDELKKGADFAYLATNKSMDPSGEKGGRIGPVDLNLLPGDARKALTEAKKDDMLGPFDVNGNWAILKLYSFNKGDYIPLETVKSEIAQTLGDDKFKSGIEAYLKKLKEVVPIEINEKAISLIEKE